MELYKGKNFDVVFVDWRQGFVGQCIVSSNKESLSKLSDEDWKELERISEKLFNATMFNFALYQDTKMN